MVLLKNVKECSTYAVRGLDNQIVAEMDKIIPGVLVRIDGISNLVLAKAVHPWLQKSAKDTLVAALKERGKPMQINSAYRTIAGQLLLYNHGKTGRCGIRVAAAPGKSNHNGASAIDIEDYSGWKPYLAGHYWRWIGSFDPMHFDCTHPGIRDLRAVSIKAFQRLWNQVNPLARIDEDGIMGGKTLAALQNSPAEGFGGLGEPRILFSTAPPMMGKDVGVVQFALRKHGIKVPVADGIFSSVTKAQVMEFQKAKGLPSDGVVGKQTLAMLIAPD